MDLRDPKISTFLVLAGLIVVNIVADSLMLLAVYADKLSFGAMYNGGLILFLISIIIMVVKIYRMIRGK